MKTTIKTRWGLGLNNHSIAEELNTAYKAGFRYMCEGNYRITNGIDAWSGMPNTTSDVFGFTTKEEAEAFALTQEWVFNKDSHPTVYEIPAYTMNWNEVKENEKVIKEAKKAERLAKEKAKAEAIGMTIEEYRKDKAKKATITRYKKETERMKKEIKEMKKEIERMEKYIKENE